jgi:hypothetical protein
MILICQTIIIICGLKFIEFDASEYMYMGVDRQIGMISRSHQCVEGVRHRRCIIHNDYPQELLHDRLTKPLTSNKLCVFKIIYHLCYNVLQGGIEEFETLEPRIV